MAPLVCKVLQGGVGKSYSIDVTEPLSGEITKVSSIFTSNSSVVHIRACITSRKSALANSVRLVLPSWG